VPAAAGRDVSVEGEDAEAELVLASSAAAGPDAGGALPAELADDGAVSASSKATDELV
jgi:hypothetical protein